MDTNAIMEAPNFLIGKAYASALYGRFPNSTAYFTNSSNYAYHVDLQVCISTTLKDETTGNPWSVYPAAKACFSVPWFYLPAFLVFVPLGKLLS